MARLATLACRFTLVPSLTLGGALLGGCAGDDVRTVEGTCPIPTLDTGNDCRVRFVDRIRSACDDGADKVEWRMTSGYGDLATNEAGTEKC